MRHIDTNGKRWNKVEDEGRWATGGGELVAINFYLRGTFALAGVISEMSCNNGALNRRESLSHRNDQSARHCLPPQLSQGKTIKRDLRLPPGIALMPVAT